MPQIYDLADPVFHFRKNPVELGRPRVLAIARSFGAPFVFSFSAVDINFIHASLLQTTLRILSEMPQIYDLADPVFHFRKNPVELGRPRVLAIARSYGLWICLFNVRWTPEAI